MGKAKIEWTYRTWNPVRGCSRISKGCTNCYAERIAARFSSPPEDGSWDGPGEPPLSWLRGGPFHTFAYANRSGSKWTGKVELVEDKLLEPLSWRKPGMCFVNSMSDLFHENLPDKAIDRVFAVMALCPHITFQVLTKRAARMREYLTKRFGAGHRGDVIRAAMDQKFRLPTGKSFPRWPEAWPLPNVWLGVSVEDRANKPRIDEFRDTPAAVRFLSLEPLLEDLGELDLRGIHWVIVGGESGHGARPCNVEWIRSIVQQCEAAGVACFVKQLGARPYQLEPPDGGSGIQLKNRKGGDWSEWPEDLRVRQFTEVRR